MEFDVFGSADAAADAGGDAVVDGESDTSDGAAERDCLFVLGWGNRPDHEPVRWLIDRLVADGWRVHTAALPVHVTNVRHEWVAPVERYAADLDEFALLGHSAGGLTAAHARVSGATTRTYLSPWWGYPPATSGPLPSLLAKIPADAKVLPSGMAGPHLLGEYATERQVAATPDRVSPRFLRATREAHDRLPAIDDDAVVFCSLSDRVVSTRAIGDRVDSDHVVLYDGGHELFSSVSRDDHLETLLGVLGQGPDALD
ncbi:hypothetical protein SAMN05216559_2193 [Halomicrobium zhouii]|uniref:AB hydrolase-1 domain-containing protein n=1 Tax=Halomicrobium zhouii TaxID=767519 RepID=A0A1I6L780_9EURY|nr:lysophospholipase [Halomicrobium zhouii]SFR99351.1 hypothetical protein SAMN05216559_2193 [Halomicrobium zhouii]